MRLAGAVTAVALLVIAAAPVMAQENDRCFRCHDDEELTGFRGDDEIPMFVSPDAYAGSIHADMQCVTCHEDLAGSRRRRHAWQR